MVPEQNGHREASRKRRVLDVCTAACGHGLAIRDLRYRVAEALDLLADAHGQIDHRKLLYN